MMALYARENSIVKELSEAFRKEHRNHQKQPCYGEHEPLTESQQQLKDDVVMRILTEHHQARPLVFRR